ncbi:hypothetical protein LRR81_08880 [Metabacillus sp. GX 13764]|uniref:hypothetical protein n=1 Tax=Metabacillus kandeliae TaxID=2900151 RepID=UPI001E41866C|nr:hypothetical protein [Metabacillus kandeliae]MCD7034348.1 hypothetical protein [Metabacillus kandeliae]
MDELKNLKRNMDDTVFQKVSFDRNKSIQSVLRPRKKFPSNRILEAAGVLVCACLLFLFLHGNLNIQSNGGNAVQHNAYVYSKLVPDFPIPPNAKAIKVKKNLIQYSLPGLVEEDGISREFQKQIEANGWKKTDQLGLMSEYSKGSKKIQLMHKTGFFYLIKPD